jgi:hypothetical protein
MIRVGDIVRWKNNALARRNVLAVRSKRSTGKRWRPRRRGDQQLHTVLSVSDRWDWRSKRNNRVVKLDDGSYCSTDWLSFVRRPKNQNPNLHNPHHLYDGRIGSLSRGIEKIDGYRSRPPAQNDNSSIRRRSRRSVTSTKRII